MRLRGNKLGELVCNHYHRVFFSAQAASRRQKRADIAEGLIRRVVDDRYELLGCQERRKLFVSNTRSWETAYSAGVTSTTPTRDFTRPLSVSRSSDVPIVTSFSLNQTDTPPASSRSCSDFASPCRSSHAWHRKISRRSGTPARLSAVCRTGASARTCVGVYSTEDPAFAHVACMRPAPPLLPDAKR